MDLVFRALILFGGAYVLLRVVGRRELAEMEPVDFILLIVLGDAIQQGLTQDDYSVTGALTTIFTIAAIQVVLGYMSFRSKRVRTLLEGEPLVLVENGRVLDKNLRRARIAEDELAEEARMSQVTSLSNVAWAVLETSGQISIIPKRSSPRPPLPAAPRCRASSCPASRAAGLWVPSDADDPRVREDRAVTVRGLLGLGVEPEVGHDLVFHALETPRTTRTNR